MSDSQFVRRHVRFSVCKTACRIHSLKDGMSDSQFVRRLVRFSVCKTACQIHNGILKIFVWKKLHEMSNILLLKKKIILHFSLCSDFRFYAWKQWKKLSEFYTFPSWKRRYFSYHKALLSYICIYMLAIAGQTAGPNWVNPWVPRGGGT